MTEDSVPPGGNQATAIRVLVAADSEVVRAGLEALVEASPALELAGSATGLADLADLAEQAQSLDADVALVYVDGGGEESVAEAGLAGLGPPPLALVVLTDDVEGGEAAALLRSGARAVLPREATAAEIVAAIEAAAAGLVVMHSEVAESLLPSLPGLRQRAPANRSAAGAPGGTEIRAPSQALTTREIQVLNMLAQGLGNKEVAWQLKISEHTVKFHISSIFTKLDASSRTEAAITGLRLGLILL